MTMPKGWKEVEKRHAMRQESSATIDQMPSPSQLSRPMVTFNSLIKYNYQIKRIEIFEIGTEEYLHPKNVKYLQIHPIEANYWIAFCGDTDDGLPLPFQNITNIKIITSSKGRQVLELGFIGNKFIGESNKQFIARINLEEKYVDEAFERLQNLKQLSRDSKYWSHETLSLPTRNGETKTVTIYPLAPFLADGEELIWQSLKSEIIANKKKVKSIDAITNYRIFQYDYYAHNGAVIMFPFLQDMNVTNQQRTVDTELIGSYFISSYNLTGIKNARASNVVGDMVFYGQGKHSLTFSQITDPETLMIAVKMLKQQYIDIGIGNILDEAKAQSTEAFRQKSEMNELAKILQCNRCGNYNNPLQSEFCNKCGSTLCSASDFSLTPIIDDPALEHRGTNIQNPEQHIIERGESLRQRVNDYKSAWDKNGVIQYKTEYMAILQRKWGMQVEFIIAFDDLTKDGYRLMAVDEGKSGSDSSGGFVAGVNAYFYFQKIKYVN